VKGQIIYKLIDGEYDIGESVKDEEKKKKELELAYKEIVQYTYQIIDKIFKNHSSKHLLNTCV